MNSKFAKFYLDTIKRHRIEYYFYPDDFKRLPIKKVSLPSMRPFITLCDYMLFLNETEERIKTEKVLIDFIDKQIIDSLVYELYFKEKFEDEELKTNPPAAVVPYLKETDNLDEIRNIVDKIKSDRRVMETISKIKSHKWVRIIEGS